MQILRQLIEIILRKRQPEDLDHDFNAALISIVCTIGVGYLVYSVMPQISQPLAYKIGMVLLQALAIYGFLAISGKATRFIQTITAIFGTTVILQILTIASGQISVLAVLGLLFTLWNLFLSVLIIRSSLECSTLKAVLVTFGYHLFMGILMSMIFPKFPIELQSILENINSAAQSGA